MPENQLQLIKNLGIAGTVTSGVTGLLQAPFNYLFQSLAAKRQNEMQKEWWNMQNEYNSPKSQMKRMMEAGLNPNLIYGQMASSNAGDVGTPAVATAQFNGNFAGSLMSGLEKTISLLQGLEALRGQKIQNEISAGELAVPDMKLDKSWFGGDVPFGLEGVDISTYKGWRQYQKLYSVLSGAQNYDYRDFRNQSANWRSLLLGQNWKFAQQNESSIFRNKLAQMEFQTKLMRNKYIFGIMQNKYQSMLNDWYVPNQVFNMAYKGVDLLLGNLIKPLLPHKIIKKIFKF